jgi:hypothetical protein
VGEACSLLVTSERDGPPMELVFHIQPTRLDIDVSGPVDPRPSAADGLSTQILEAVVDEFDIGANRIRLAKLRSS